MKPYFTIRVGAIRGCFRRPSSLSFVEHHFGRLDHAMILSPFLRLSCSALRRVMTLSIWLLPKRTTTWGMISPNVTSKILPSSWFRADMGALRMPRQDSPIQRNPRGNASHPNEVSRGHALFLRTGTEPQLRRKTLTELRTAATVGLCRESGRKLGIWTCIVTCFGTIRDVVWTFVLCVNDHQKAYFSEHQADSLRSFSLK